METPENSTKKTLNHKKTLKSISNQRQPPEPPHPLDFFIFSLLPSPNHSSPTPGQSFKPAAPTGFFYFSPQQPATKPPAPTSAFESPSSPPADHFFPVKEQPKPALNRPKQQPPAAEALSSSRWFPLLHCHLPHRTSSSRSPQRW